MTFYFSYHIFNTKIFTVWFLGDGCFKYVGIKQNKKQVFKK